MTIIPLTNTAVCDDQTVKVEHRSTDEGRRQVDSGETVYYVIQKDGSIYRYIGCGVPQKITEKWRVRKVPGHSFPAQQPQVPNNSRDLEDRAPNPE
jgi:hypothetical protein